MPDNNKNGRRQRPGVVTVEIDPQLVADFDRARGLIPRSPLLRPHLEQAIRTLLRDGISAHRPGA